MNSDQIMSAVRWVLATLGTYLVSKGLLNTDQVGAGSAYVTTIAGALMPLVALVWSMFHHAAPPPPVPPPNPPAAMRNH